MQIYTLIKLRYLFAHEHKKVPDSTLTEVNPPKVYPQSKDCYQSQNTPPDSQV